MNRSRLGGRASWIAALLYVTLLVVCVLTPLAGLLIWLLPAPMVVFGVQGHQKTAIVLGVVSLVALFLAGLGIAAVVFAAGLYFVSWVMAESISHEESAYPALITGTLVFVMMGLVSLAFLHWAGVDFTSQLAFDSQKSIDMSQPFLHLSQTDVKGITGDVTSNVTMMIPAILCILAFLGTLLNFVIAGSIMSLTKGFHRPPILSTWRIPSSVVLVYIVCMTGSVFGWMKGSTFWWHALNNAAITAGFFVCIQGIALVWRKVRRFPLAYLWLLLLGVLATVLNSLFIFLGLLDVAWMRRTR